MPLETKMRYIIILLATLILSTFSNIHASKADYVFVSGNELFQYCTKSAKLSFQHSYCEGFITSVADTMGSKYPVFGLRACFYGGTTQQQVREVAIKWLFNHPEKREFGAASLVATALSESFKCPPE